MLRESMTRILLSVPMACGLLFTNAHAITLGQVDDFQDGTLLDWDTAFNNSYDNLADAGPAGVGDNAMEVDFGNRTVLFNESQWAGDWTGAGVQTITLDVRSPTPVGGSLTFWLGISNGTPASGGGGNTWVTSASQVAPADGAWHKISFDVTAPSWDAFGSGTDIATDLQNVTHFRIIQNTSQSFLGQSGGGVIQFDNIAAVPEPTAALLGALGLGLAGFSRTRPRRA